MKCCPEIGERLKAMRESAGLTQKRFAAFVTESGRDGTTISKLEKGVINPSRATVGIYVMASIMTPEQVEEAMQTLEEMMTRDQ